MAFWKLQDGQAVKLGAFCHKQQGTWTPQWTDDESYVGRMVSNEVQFYKAEGLGKIAFRIQADNLGSFLISPGAYPKVAIFVKEAKGQPGAVKIFLLPNTATPVTQKTFFKADLGTLTWSSSGKHLLAMAQTDVDTTGVSYYGETNLYFLSGDGSFDCRVQLDKEGPIHDFAWSPRSDEFIVLYGYVPAKAMLFDLKCKEIFEFPVGSKNHIRWNQRGSLICFGGFGNLPGHVEIWSRSGAIRRVGHCQSQGSSLCEWAPDGGTLITAVLTPRLRVDNNFKLWNWDGTLLSSNAYKELYHVAWREMSSKLFKEVDTSKVPMVASGPLNTDTTAKREVYRPPGLRNQPPKTPPSLPVTKETAQAAPKITQASALSKEERVVRRLKEKLDQIVLLKEKHQKGEQLELNQLEKIEKEFEIQKEYEKAVQAMKATLTAAGKGCP